MTQVLTEGTDLAVREPNWMAPRVALPIQSHEDYVQVAESLKAVKEFEKQVLAWFKPLKEKAYAAWKALTAKENETLAPARAYEADVKGAMAVWDTKQEEIRLAEERRLAEEARKAEEARLLAEAAALEAEGIAEGDETKIAEAEQLIAAPVETPVVTVEKATPKVAGITYRENWNAKVVDLGKLIRFVAENPAYQNLLVPNMTALNGQAKSLKENMAIPGVKAYSTRVVAAR